MIVINQNKIIGRELDENNTVRKIDTDNLKTIKIYNLDMTIAVGYRVN